MLRHTARALVFHDNHLLLMERWRPGKHYFSIPGGGIEADETPEQAAARELYEETGCQIAIGRLLYSFETAEGNVHAIFLGTYLSGEPHLPAGSPEALAHDPDNRFQPGWVPVTQLSTLDFLVWDPVMHRVLRDLRSGLPETPVQLASKD